MSLIELENSVNKSEIELLKYGIYYYYWKKSRKKNKYYLLSNSKRNIIKCNFLILIALLIALISSIFIYKKNGFSLATEYFIVLAAIIVCVCIYINSVNKICKLIKSSVIAIFDIDEQFLIIRNCSNLPFVQIHERRQFFRINDIEKLEYDYAYEINNKGIIIWDRIGYVPSWTAVYIYIEQKKILLFVGNKLPQNFYNFFNFVVKLKIEEKKDYSR